MQAERVARRWHAQNEVMGVVFRGVLRLPRPHHRGRRVRPICFVSWGVKVVSCHTDSEVQQEASILKSCARCEDLNHYYLSCLKHARTARRSYQCKTSNAGLKMNLSTIYQAAKLAGYVAAVLIVSVSVASRMGRAADDLPGVEETHALIPMRDGVRLSAWIYVPEAKGPWPVLMEQRYSDVHAGRARYARLARHGYVVAGINFRGTGQSEGTFVGYHDLAWGERRDGYDATEWLAGQKWSNGKVGSFGGSQAGFAQNLQAVTQPPHLVCQFMVDTGLSLFHDGYRMGGATRYVQFRIMERFCSNPEDNRRLVEEWTRHPTYDDYWAAEDAGRHFDKMDVPCFTVASWYDDPKGDSSLRSFLGRQYQGGQHSRGNQKLIVGPWPHGGSKGNVVGDLIYPKNASLSVEEQMLRWFGHYLQEKDTGVAQIPAVSYYVMGTVGEPDAPGNTWRDAVDFPPVSQATSYYFQPEGQLATGVPAEDGASTHYNVDPTQPAMMPELVSRDMQEYESDPGVITFTSTPLIEPMEWTGQVHVELLVSSTARDTDFIVKVCDVYPDGRSIALINSVRRARYREGFEQQVLLEPGKVAKLAFDIGWLSQIFNQGHRIRVIVASTGAPYYEPNPQTGLPITSRPPTETQPAENRVFHNRLYPSRIVVPRIASEASRAGPVSSGTSVVSVGGTRMDGTWGGIGGIGWHAQNEVKGVVFRGVLRLPLRCQNQSRKIPKVVVLAARK